MITTNGDGSRLTLPPTKCAYCKRGLQIGMTLEMIPQIECQRCLVDGTTPLRLCLACFCNPTKHDWSHPYIVPQDSDTLPSPIKPEGWTQRQDLALLHGTEKLGYGNWEDISAEVFRGVKKPSECRERFEMFRQLVGETPLKDDVGVDMAECDERLRQKQQIAKSVPGAGLEGYMPLREDFDVVFANDTEQILGDMVFGKEDEDEQENATTGWNDLKLNILRAYNMKIDIRESRKRFVIERGLLDFGKLQEARKRQKSSTKVGEDILAFEIEQLQRFIPLAKQDALVRSIQKERVIRDEIRKLQQYRAMGIRTYDEIDAYNQLAANRHALVSANRFTPPHTVRPPLDPQRVNDDPNKDVLTNDELIIANQLSLTPTEFLIVKECILGEASRNGGCVSTDRMMAKLSIEITMVDALLDFFVKCERVTRNPPSQPSDKIAMTFATQ